VARQGVAVRLGTCLGSLGRGRPISDTPSSNSAGISKARRATCAVNCLRAAAAGPGRNRPTAAIAGALLSLRVCISVISRCERCMFWARACASGPVRRSVRSWTCDRALVVLGYIWRNIRRTRAADLVELLHLLSDIMRASSMLRRPSSPCLLVHPVMEEPFVATPRRPGLEHPSSGRFGCWAVRCGGEVLTEVSWRVVRELDIHRAGVVRDMLAESDVAGVARAAEAGRWLVRRRALPGVRNQASGQYNADGEVAIARRSWSR